MSVAVDLLIETELPDGAAPDSLPELVEWVLLQEGQSGEWSIALVLTTDDAVRALHAQFMDDDSVTDIMTFPAEDPGGSQGGDIVVSVDRAIEQSAEWGLTPWEEIRFLAAHGVLHLCGWLDHSHDERSAMLERQQELINAFDFRTRAELPA